MEDPIDTLTYLVSRIIDTARRLKLVLETKSPATSLGFL